MIRVVRSELVRLARLRLLAGWFGLTALFAVMVNFVMFSVATDQASMPTGPAAPSGVISGLSAAASMFGVLTFAFWAMSAAGDYQTGLIRMLASAQPHRWKLVIGKAIALMLITAVAATVAMMVCLMAAPIAAEGAGISTTAWGSVVLFAWLNAYASMIVWGAIGFALATVFRSSAIAISVGVGYVLVVESVIGMAMDNPSWLLGSTMQALAAGGNSAVEYPGAVTLAVAYVAISMVIATVVTSRRDISV
jgi:ABC-type transport system involved in multi-copper enzyme maturation permease subunit